MQPKHAFGSEGDAKRNIPGNAVVQFEIQLLEFKNPKASYEMNVEEKSAAATSYKNEGNTYYNAKKYNLAVRKYKSALEYFENESSLTDEQKAQVTKNINVKKKKKEAKNLNSVFLHIVLGSISFELGCFLSQITKI